MKFAFIEAEKAFYPLVILCAVLGVSRSGFYAWRRRPKSARAVQDARLAIEVSTSHQRSRRTYGSPRVHADLKARGVRIGKKRVARLMREQRLIARQKRRFRRTTDSNHAQPIAPNLLARNFETSAPNEAWVTDVTYVATAEGWLYLAVIIDLFARRVVGWAMSSANDTALALDALRGAIARRRPRAGLIHHSDRGSPYASELYRRTLDRHELIASMSRRGDCWDNAVAESFFATIRAELLDHVHHESHEHAMADIGEYIECFYNRVRRHSHSDYVSPIEFELRAQTATVAA